MPRQINFLAERQKGVSKTQRQDVRFLRLSLIILSITGVMAMIVLGVSFFFSSQLNQIETQKVALRSEIVGNQENEAAYIVYIKKLASLTSLYKDREDKNNIISYFSSLFGPNVIVAGIDYDQVDKLLHFKVLSPDVFVLQQALNTLNSATVQSRFSALTTSKLRRQSDATYEFTINVPNISPASSI